MKIINTADNYYNLYTASQWENNRELQNKYRDLWLDIQQKYLPSGTLGKCYQAKIDKVRSNPEEKTKKLENKLLEQRFSFSAEINGRSYSYKELLSVPEGDICRKEVRKALLNEAFALIDAGLGNLIHTRNNIARRQGYENYWIMKNSDERDGVDQFLERMDHDLMNIVGVLLHKPPHNSPPLGVPVEEIVKLEDALEFFCSMLFARQEIPKLELKLRKGDQCRPGPPSVQPLAYRPDNGHILGMELPFIHQNSFEQGKLGALFHELTHLFHFASIDNRGGHAFPPELARNNLLYEAEALCYQNLVNTAWKGGPFSPDWHMLKDLVYLAETERQLYLLEPANSKNIRDLIVRRIDEHYQDGSFGRTPIGASHLLRGESAAQYWIYPAAHWISFKRTIEILKNESALSIPDYWAEGNEASYRCRLDDLLDANDISSFLSGETILEPQYLQRRYREEINRELEEMGLMAVLLDGQREF